MWYGETKVYFDGSHYIAIPHTTRFVKKKIKPPEELITVSESEESTLDEVTDVPSFATQTECNENNQNTDNLSEKTQKTTKNTIKMTKKELFEQLYCEFIDLPKKARMSKIVEKMLPYFEKQKYCENFVKGNFERKQRNLICRRVRMSRKAYLARFNYFVTFTYDGDKHTEFTFKKKLIHTLGNFACRKNWKYMGVWERAPETNRLHFHGLFNIPDGEMVGELFEKKDYSFEKHDVIITVQNTYFNERFGRSDFKEIDEHENKLSNALSYLMKYIEKTGEKIVYSKKLYQYFISDILENDIVSTIGQEDKKILLFDDFECIDEGVLMGKVSPEVIEQMRKCN